MVRQRDAIFVIIIIVFPDSRATCSRTTAHTKPDSSYDRLPQIKRPHTVVQPIIC